MGTRLGSQDDDFSAFTTPVESVRSRSLKSVPDDDVVEETGPAEGAENHAASESSADKKATATPATKKPAPPASQPPSRHKVAIPPELYKEMHSVKNDWLRVDADRMDAYSKPLNVDNTFMVTLLAFATAVLKEEIEKDGGVSTTFPDYMPRKPGARE